MFATVSVIDDAQREELRRFLKERRARLTPAEAGLPAGTRRRVPGLQREEVATLAGIGVSWYTNLENGEAAGVSNATLAAVATALQLSPSERDYLIALAGPVNDEAEETPDPLVTATLKAIAFPAYIIRPTWEVVDYNAAFARVWAIGDGELPFSAVGRLFLHPAARAMHGEHFIANITPVIAMVRSSQGRRPNSKPLRDLRDRIVADAGLRDIWNAYEISSPLLTNACTIASPLGAFRYESLTMPLPGSMLGIVVHVPDAESQRRILTDANVR